MSWVQTSRPNQHWAIYQESPHRYWCFLVYTELKRDHLVCIGTTMIEPGKCGPRLYPNYPLRFAHHTWVLSPWKETVEQTWDEIMADPLAWLLEKLL